MSSPDLIATYRLQLCEAFDFAAATAVVPYLQRLGISHLYLSPVSEARPGSTHGYDATDMNRIRAALGGEVGLQVLLDSCVAHGLAVVIDIVPNHAGLGPQNAAWQDVLAYGQQSPHASTFDIEWQAAKPELSQRVLLPFLGSNYGLALRAGELAPVFEHDRLYLAYFDHRFALSPATYPALLELALVGAKLTAPQRSTLIGWQKRWRSWQRGDHASSEKMLKQWTTEMLEMAPALRAAWLQAALGAEAAGPLHAALQQQHWRLANWRTASHEINYRRFFEINDLIGLRMEDPQVFAASHAGIDRLLQHPAVVGLRVDHVDGLYDPQDYLARLKKMGPAHIWVEKILAPQEKLCTDWACDGTTGYEFGAAVIALFTPPLGVAAMTQIYRSLADGPPAYAELVLQSKRLIMTTKLAGELQRLAHQLDRLSEANVDTRDFTFLALREALVEITAAMERYRTYLPHGRGEAATAIAAAVAQAQARNVSMDASLFQFVGEALTRPSPPPAWVSFIGRWQQYCAPVMAKSVEDTAFFRDPCLLAHNEVGASPAAAWSSNEVFCEQASWRQQHAPRNLLATSTHDSKRGEDTRLRLALLAEEPQAWGRLVQQLLALGEPRRMAQGSRRFPEVPDLYLFLQSLVAVWAPGEDPTPLRERLGERWLKSAREAKRITSWTNPHPAYEASLRRYAEGLLSEPEAFVALDAFVRPLAERALWASLCQLVLKCTTPGVPDIYQGCECLDLSLVDPDNRRPVDYARRAALLAQELDLAHWRRAHPDALKLCLTHRLMTLRRKLPDLRKAPLVPLTLAGKASSSMLAYRRGSCLIWVATRFLNLQRADTLAKGLDDTTLVLPGSMQGLPLFEHLGGEPISGCVEIPLAPRTLPMGILTVAVKNEAPVRG